MSRLNCPAPALPLFAAEYDQKEMQILLKILRLYFTRLDALGPIECSTLTINLNTLPTDADLATLRDGAVYRDTTAGNVLKVKV